MSEQLLPCPFCGSDRVTPDKVLRDGYRIFADDPDAYAHFVRCLTCAAQGGWKKSESGAAMMWNMRLGKWLEER